MPRDVQPDDWRLILRGYGFRCIEVGPASAKAATLAMLNAMSEVVAAANDDPEAA